MPSTSLQILVVDDEKTSRMLLESTLREWGHQVTACSSALEALALLQCDPGIQLLITDWEMPDMDGIELCACARRLQREHYLSVIVLTAKGSKEHYLAALEAGADAFLSKSFDLTELYLQLQVVVRISTLESRLASQIVEAEQARAEAERVSRFKSDFLANMSHEIRTPMNGVLGMVGHLLGGSLEPVQREYADLIRQSAENLLVVLNDILDFSKIEAGRLEVERIPFSPTAVAAEALSPFVVRSLDSGVALTGLFDVQVAEETWGDPARFRQVLINLVSNSIKFTTEGSVTLRLEVEGEELVASVQDTGPGIPEAQVQEIFQPFTQVDPSIHRRYGGTGLGLAICQRLVELMGGRLELSSQLGEGTEVRCYLPRDARDRAAAPGPDESTGFWIWAGDDAYAQLIRQTLEGLGQPGQPWRFSPGWSGCLVVDSCRATPEEVAEIAAGAGPGARILVLHTSNQPWQLESPVLTMVARPFTTLSLLQALRGKEQDQDGETGADPTSAGTLRVVLAEDNPIGQTVVRLMLEQEECEVTVVADGQEAVDECIRGDYDLALMDVQMPTLNGLEATRQIREWEAEHRRPPLPIVALTALAYESDRKLALEVGMNSFLTKPVVISELKHLLRELRKG